MEVGQTIHPERESLWPLILPSAGPWKATATSPPANISRYLTQPTTMGNSEVPFMFHSSNKRRRQWLPHPASLPSTTAAPEERNWMRRSPGLVDVGRMVRHVCFIDIIFHHQWYYTYIKLTQYPVINAKPTVVTGELMRHGIKSHWWRKNPKTSSYEMKA